jgi:subtilisin family serine protease
MAIAAIIIFPFQETNAQSGKPFGQKITSLYYYFGSQKINLTESSTHIYVETRQAEQTLALLVGLQQLQAKAGAQVQTLSVSTRSVISITNHVAFDSTLAWLLQQPGVLLARPAVYHEQSKESLYEERFYVKLKPGISTLVLQNEVAKTGCSIISPYDYDKRVYLINAGSNTRFDGLKMANQFYETGLFEFSEPDFRPLDILHSPPSPNDPLFNLQWALKNTGTPSQFNGTPGADIGVEDAWMITKGSPAIRIAVIDEGVDRSHPDLINNIDPLGFGLTPANATTGSPLADARSHGTSCGGIIAAEADNGIGVAGVAPLCKIIPVNLSVSTNGSFGTSSQLATCIDWAWNQGGADIISNSWGGGTASSLIHEAIKRATTLGRGGKGAIVLFSSGNADAGLASPAIFPETIAVGAMDMCYQRKSINTCDAENFWGGNYGAGLDVSAPGVKIATTRNGGSYNQTFNGTSSACPIAAGITALILSVNNNLTQEQVRTILERSTRKVGNYTYSRVSGQPNGSWSNQLGYGMVNAHNAVLAAQNFDFACKVSISANGPTQFCTGGSVNLSVNNVAGAAIYAWLRNGVVIGSGSSLNATTTGLYQATILRPGGCTDTSIGISVRAPSSGGALQARAGNDTAICFSNIHILGGGPAAISGTPIHNPLRGMAHNGASNEFIRFNPEFPAEFFKSVKSNFNPDEDEFYSGGANTPYGLFMISRNNKFVKADTATGQIINIGNAIPASGYLWNGMTYNPLQQKIYAIAGNGSANQLYEINLRTGIATLIGSIGGAFNMTLVWIAADANGDMYTMRVITSGNAQIFKIGLNPLSVTALPSGTGFSANYAQGADFDPISGKLLLFGSTRALGSGSDFPGRSLWEANKTTGATNQIGAVGQPFNWLDALTFAGPEYQYNWSPATYLSNAKAPNPVFSGAPAGTYPYTLTVTDLCGQIKQDNVTVVVNPLPIPPAISPASPVLSYANQFRDTLLHNGQQAGINYQWTIGNVVQPEPSNKFPIDFTYNPNNQFRILATNQTTGCVSTGTNTVQFSYEAGQRLNTNTGLTVCNTSFYDVGGPTLNTGSLFTRTFTPSIAGSKLTLTLFQQLLNNNASLIVYDGNSDNAPVLDSITAAGNGTNIRSFTASNASGELTVRFRPGSASSTGWLGGLTCAEPLQYRSVNNGLWSNKATWQSKPVTAANNSWAAANRPPNIGDDFIHIRHWVTVESIVVADQVTVTSTGRLTVTAGSILRARKFVPAPEIKGEPGGVIEVLPTGQIQILN